MISTFEKDLRDGVLVFLNRGTGISGSRDLVFLHSAETLVYQLFEPTSLVFLLLGNLYSNQARSDFLRSWIGGFCISKYFLHSIPLILKRQVFDLRFVCIYKYDMWIGCCIFARTGEGKWKSTNHKQRQCLP